MLLYSVESEAAAADAANEQRVVSVTMTNSPGRDIKQKNERWITNSNLKEHHKLSQHVSTSFAPHAWCVDEYLPETHADESYPPVVISKQDRLV